MEFKTPLIQSFEYEGSFVLCSYEKLHSTIYGKHKKIYSDIITNKERILVKERGVSNGICFIAE